MKQYRTAIVGNGNIARSHMRAFEQEKERVEVVAAVDIIPERVQSFSDTYGIPNRYTDTATMLAEQKPDLVHICTPPNVHFELSVAALQAGADVICEKPLCGSLAQVDQLQKVERESGKTCSVIFQWRYGSGTTHFKRLIDSHELGRPLVALCNTTWFRNQAYYEVPWRGKWDTELGGVTMGHGIHAMDFFIYLMGDWVELNAMMGTLDRYMEVEDVSMAQVRFTNGAFGSIINSVLSPREVSYLRFDFQHATVELEHLYSHRNEHWRYSVPPGYEQQLEEWADIQEDIQATHAAQLHTTLDVLDEGGKPLTTGAQARNTVEFLTSLYKSALTRQPVERGSITPDDPFYYHVYGAVKPARDLRLFGPNV